MQRQSTSWQVFPKSPICYPWKWNLLHFTHKIRDHTTKAHLTHLAFKPQHQHSTSTLSPPKSSPCSRWTRSRVHQSTWPLSEHRPGQASSCLMLVFVYVFLAPLRVNTYEHSNSIALIKSGALQFYCADSIWSVRIPLKHYNLIWSVRIPSRAL